MKTYIYLSICALFYFTNIQAQNTPNVPPTSKEIKNHFEWVRKEIHNADSKNVLVIAHRGDWRNAPENSIQALKNCIRMGIDLVEIDLSMTKDSQLVLMHDHTIDRTMSGKGLVKNYTLAELKAMTLKSANECPSAHTIPTFKEFMLAAKNKVFINIDKCYAYYPQVYKTLQETQTLNQVIINTEKDLADNQMKYGNLLSLLPIKPVINLNKNTYKEIEEYKNIHPKVIEFVFDTDSSRYLNEKKIFQKSHIKILMNAMWSSLSANHTDDIAVEQHNTKDSWDWLIEHGATMIQSDRPYSLLQYLRKQGKHM